MVRLLAVDPERRAQPALRVGDQQDTHALALLVDDQIAQCVALCCVFMQILDISRRLAVAQRTAEFAQIDRVERDAKRLPVLRFMPPIEIVVPAVHVHDGQPVAKGAEPPPLHARGERKRLRILAHEGGDDLALVVVAEMDRGLLVPLQHMVRNPFVHLRACGVHRMQRIARLTVARLTG